MELTDAWVDKLVGSAEDMLRFSYVPYSGFSVGAALLTSDGRIFTGCNIENASYTPCNCAERTAFFKAVSEGITSFCAIAVVGGYDRKTGELCPPCGVCRQVMMEFCDPETFRIILADAEGRRVVKTLSEILPLGFGPAKLIRKG